MKHTRFFFLFLITLPLFLFLLLSLNLRMQFVEIDAFDEPIYISAASMPSQVALFDGHPPLGKWIYSLGNTFGVALRTISLVFGILLLFFIKSLLTRIAFNVHQQCLTVLILLGSQFILTYSNIVSLEIIATCISVAVLLLLLQEKSPSWIFRDCSIGILLGLGCLTKWSVLAMYLVTVIDLLFIHSLYCYSERTIRLLRVTLCMLTTYVFLFIAITDTSLLTFFNSQLKLYHHLLHYTATHPWQSAWWQWPLGITGIEILTSTTRKLSIHGLVWVNLVGIYVTAKSLKNWKYISNEMRTIISACLLTWLLWGIIPRSTQFIYYFFIPSMLLSIIACRWAISVDKRWKSSLFYVGTLLNGLLILGDYCRLIDI